MRTGGLHLRNWWPTIRNWESKRGGPSQFQHEELLLDLVSGSPALVPSSPASLSPQRRRSQERVDMDGTSRLVSLTVWLFASKLLRDVPVSHSCGMYQLSSVIFFEGCRDCLTDEGCPECTRGACLDDRRYRSAWDSFSGGNPQHTTIRRA
jgi:hypothetical protein